MNSFERTKEVTNMVVNALAEGNKIDPIAKEVGWHSIHNLIHPLIDNCVYAEKKIAISDSNIEHMYNLAKSLDYQEFVKIIDILGFEVKPRNP